jgi:L-lysine exporter family protein LysE/ArgO
VLGAAVQGFAMGAGLIIAIGAQNAFVLSQGVRREHHLAVAFTCSLCDAALITLGVGGLGALVAAHPQCIRVVTWVGAAFLFAYGLRAFLAARRPGGLLAAEAPRRTLRATLATTLALTLLNPHVYLDTVVLLGSLSARHAGTARLGFGAGAVLASFAWFFALALGGGLLAPLFRRPSTWRILDLCVGCTMWLAAWSLVH